MGDIAEGKPVRDLSDAQLRAGKVKILVLDVDGVLTDGRLIIGQDGEMAKAFHAQDGMGITLAKQAGLKIAIITGRESRIVANRAAELRIADVYQGAGDKLLALSELLKRHSLEESEAAYAGDDLNDLPALARAGLACTVASAVPEVKEMVHWIAPRPGGQGGVRDIIEFILKTQNRWESLVSAYLRTGAGEIRQ